MILKTLMLLITLVLASMVYELHFTRVSLEKLSIDIRDDWQRNEATRYLIRDDHHQIAKDLIRIREITKKKGLHP